MADIQFEPRIAVMYHIYPTVFRKIQKNTVMDTDIWSRDLSPRGTIGIPWLQSMNRTEGATNE